MSTMYPAVVIFCFLFTARAEDVRHTSVVALKNGASVRGFVHRMMDGTEVNLFMGIRYGQVNRRFENANPYTWTGTVNATKPMYACPQPNFEAIPGGINAQSMSEDCLFVNVYQPVTQKTNRSVMVWFYGGGFITGTIFTDLYDNSILAAKGDVVVVSVNYRVNAFGFLYSGDQAGDAPGNQGLHDQVLALQWVRDNIEHFGGNSAKVTIFGESAGSMSVGALLVSPLAEGLFKRAIMQSGAPFAYMGCTSKQEALRRTDNLTEKLGCKHSSMRESIDCVRSKSSSEILDAYANAFVNGEWMIPIYGDALIPEHPVQALQSGHFHKVDLMFGTVRDEGSMSVLMFMPELNPEIKHPNITIEKTKAIISLVMMLVQVEPVEDIVEFYSKDLDPNNVDQLRTAISDALGDYVLTCPTILFGEEMSKQLPEHKFFTYRLMEHYHSYVAAFPCTGWMGVCHGEDVFYLFGKPFLDSSDEYEKRLSQDMIEAWTLFAKTGSPGSVGNITWLQSLDRTQPNSSVRYMSLDSHDYKIEYNVFKERCDTFWKPKFGFE